MVFFLSDDARLNIMYSKWGKRLRTVRSTLMKAYYPILFVLIDEKRKLWLDDQYTINL